MWNWQHSNWPNFNFRSQALASLEVEFQRRAGEFLGTVRHVGSGDRDQLVIDLICTEAFKTSEIEGELLNRDSLQSSLRKHFGLPTDGRQVPPAESGISQIMVELYRDPNLPLSEKMLCDWHKLLMVSRYDLADVGRYRTHESAMQVVSGPIHEPVVHFEGPPSKAVPAEMERFISWFNSTAPVGEKPLPLLTRAGIAHIYFESIHPFEDGNGRLGRALVEKVISQGIGQATLTALSQTINAKRKDYYSMLARHNRDLEVTGWLEWFAEILLTAQAEAQRSVDFLIRKTEFLNRFRGRLNNRQQKALLRMFREGPDGFEGGLSAKNYISITGATQPTATRDLRELVEIGALNKTGALKSTRYHL